MMNINKPALQPVFGIDWDNEQENQEQTRLRPSLLA